MGEKQEKYEKHEKQEKGEKQEKHEKGGAGGTRFGPFMGGLILIWVGVSLFLAYYDYIGWEIFWAYLISGIGVVLLVVGLLLRRYPEPGSNPSGLLVGGAVMVVIGAFSVVAWQGFGVEFWSSFWSHFWVFVPIIVGVLIIIGALSAMRRSPKP